VFNSNPPKSSSPGHATRPIREWIRIGPLAWILLVPPASPAAPPALSGLFPAGGARGQSVEVTASGKFGRWPVRAWVDEPGVVFEPAADEGKLTARIAPDAPPGVRLVRLYDHEGASEARPFVVGVLPEAVEQEPNVDADEAHAVATLPITVNGRLGKRGDVDTFRISLQKGQTLMAALGGRQQLGSPMDGVLQLASPDGLVLEQADDSPGLDPRLIVTAPADGEYLVRLFAFPATPNSTIALAGGDDFLYRLTLTTSGFLDRVQPSAVEAGRAGFVEALGWNLPDGLSRLRVGPSARLDRVRAWHPQLAGVVDVPVVTHPSLVEVEAGSAGEPQALTLPGSVSGRIEREGDEDRFQITLTKGRACRFEVHARSLGSPLDPVLSVIDGAGKRLVEQDDPGRRGNGGRDPRLSFDPPTDGPFDLVIRDLNDRGGPEFAYRLDLIQPTPDFALRLKEDRVSVAPGKSATIPVTIARSDGFDQPIALEVVGLPEGVTARPATSEPQGDSSKSVTLTLDAAAGAPPFSGPVAIVGRSGELEHVAEAVVSGLEATLDHAWLAVPPPAE
jgi:hypothetical protein